jgi:hypothetical protein
MTLNDLHTTLDRKKGFYHDDPATLELLGLLDDLRQCVEERLKVMERQMANIPIAQPYKNPEAH